MTEYIASYRFRLDTTGVTVTIRDANVCDAKGHSRVVHEEPTLEAARAWVAAKMRSETEAAIALHNAMIAMEVKRDAKSE